MKAADQFEKHPESEAMRRGVVTYNPPMMGAGII